MRIKSLIVFLIVFLEILTVFYLCLSLTGRIELINILEHKPYTVQNVTIKECLLPRRLSSDPDLYYELIPGVKCKFIRNGKEIEVNINTYGFRDKEFDYEKNKDVALITAMGDSYTYGWKVDLKDSWPKKLEKILNEHSKREFEVLNFGIPGYDIKDVSELFEKKVRFFHSNVVIIVFKPDDVVPERIAVVNDSFSKDKVDSLLNNKTWIEDYINTSFSLLRNNFDGPIIILLFPVGFKPILENLAKTYKINVCSREEIYNTHNINELIISNEDMHPNEFAYSLIANKTFECLNEYFSY